MVLPGGVGRSDRTEEQRHRPGGRTAAAPSLVRWLEGEDAGEREGAYHQGYRRSGAGTAGPAGRPRFDDTPLLCHQGLDPQGEICPSCRGVVPAPRWLARYPLQAESFWTMASGMSVTIRDASRILAN